MLPEGRRGALHDDKIAPPAEPVGLAGYLLGGDGRST